MNKKGNYQEIYGAYTTVQRMIRKDGFKLIVYPKINKVLLFDMENDPEEINDLAEEPDYKNKVEGLFSDLIMEMKEMGDGLDLNRLFNDIKEQ